MLYVFFSSSGFISSLLRKAISLLILALDICLSFHLKLLAFLLSYVFVSALSIV